MENIHHIMCVVEVTMKSKLTKTFFFYFFFFLNIESLLLRYTLNYGKKDDHNFRFILTLMSTFKNW